MKVQRVNVALAWLLVATPAMAQKDGAPANSQPPKRSADAAPANGEKLSDAERITRLQAAIQQNEELLSQSQRQIDDPNSEYAQAEQAFKKLDEELQAKKKEVTELKTGGVSEDLAAAEKRVEALQAQWELAKERFDLAIQGRRAVIEQMSSLRTKLDQDKAALQRLVAPSEPVKTEGSATPAPTTDGTKPAEPAKPASPPATSAPTGSAPQEATPAAPSAPVTLPGVPAPAATPPPAETTTPPAKPKPEDKKLTEAKEQAAVKESEAQKAEQEVRTIEERIVTLKKTIESEKSLLTTARKKVENTRETERTLSDQAQQLAADGGPRDQIQQTWTSVREARQRLVEAQDEVRQRVDRIGKLQDDLANLQSERIRALEEVEQKRTAAEEAQKRVTRIENPFSPANLLKWSVEHGPRIAAIIIVAVVLLALVRLVDRRLVGMIAGKTDRGSQVERENRAVTLVSVFHNAAHVLIIIGSLIMIIAEFQLNIAPLMGGAAVLGLAVAFGAQNLIRDFFTGFIILLENQYGVNDVVRIGENAGLVERITLRLTVLRDLEGVVHFIPNGEVKTVRNMTHGWSRAVLDIGVAYKENVDRVMEVLMELAHGLRKDPEFRYRIMSDPEMLGVDAFGDSAVVIKLMIKTQPLQQWAVKRELMRRIKNRFDELGIEIPFPHRTVFHRVENGHDLAEQLSRQKWLAGHESSTGH